MSASSAPLRNARDLNYSFLAVKASNALRNALAHRPIEGEELEVLRRAERFLSEVADGALLATKGTIRDGMSPRRSMDSLDYAIGTLDALKELMKEDDVSSFFRHLAEAVHAIAEGGQADQGDLEAAVSFFDFLYRSLATDIAHRRSAIGGRHRRSLAYVG